MKFLKNFFTRSKRFKQNLVSIRDDLRNDKPLMSAFVEKLLEDKKGLSDIKFRCK
ncbi:hypothetical protein [uncultured Campylobacter sp.]|uniref:hypothetical protein n=1 Tax=uncultured Campylobacter sp. TaxID=218934 RepID=UPI00262FD04D|nr:hypothetical protein [uncultured Campylobacter sp.]